VIIETPKFRFEDYQSPADAELTARWFAAWVRLRGRDRDPKCYRSADGVEVYSSGGDSEPALFFVSLCERARAGEKLPTVVPPPLREYAEKGYAPEDVAPLKIGEASHAQRWRPTNPATIAALLSTEHATNAIRMIANPRLLFTACKLLRRVGMHKPLFRVPDRYIYGAVLSNATAMQVMLEYSLLCGAPSAEWNYPFWDGWGRFLGWQRGAAIADFKSGGKQDSLLIIKLNAAEDMIAPLLQPPTA
jgi:hypothetical protein